MSQETEPQPGVAPKPMTREERNLSLTRVLTVLMTIGPLIRRIFPAIQEAIDELKKLIADLKSNPGP
jgi:hypothetical protein